MHNLKHTDCESLIKKYRASLSLNGKVVDVVDLNNNVVASFVLVIRYGKVILEEQISHSIITIPVTGEPESLSPFTYDKETDRIHATITKTDATTQCFSASISDLMHLDSFIFKPKDKFEDNNHFHHGHHEHCDCIGFEPPKHDKPLVDPYVTRSELAEEAKKRKLNDMQIRDMIGDPRNDKKSLHCRIEGVETAIDHEVERSKREDKDINERLDNFNLEFDNFNEVAQRNHNDLLRRIREEEKSREDACGELNRLIHELNVGEDITRKKIEKLNHEINGVVNKLEDKLQDISDGLTQETNERMAGDKEMVNLLRIEETNRFSDIKHVYKRIDVEHQRATFAEKDLEHKLHNFVDKIIQNDTLLTDKINELEKSIENINKKLDDLNNA